MNRRDVVARAVLGTLGIEAINIRPAAATPEDFNWINILTGQQMGTAYKELYVFSTRLEGHEIECLYFIPVIDDQLPCIIGIRPQQWATWYAAMSLNASRNPQIQLYAGNQGVPAVNQP